VACFAGLSLLGISFLLFPELIDGLDLIRQWLSRTQGFSAYQRIGEAQPILIEQGRFDATMALERLSYFFFVFPLSVIGLGFAARRDANRESTWSVLFWATGLFAAVLMQRRFFNSFSIGLALVTALALIRIHAACGTGLLRKVSRPWATGVILIGSLLATAPMLAGFAPYLPSYTADLEDRPVDLTALQRTVRVHHRVSDWLRQNTPSPGEWLATEPRPSYGILAPSNFGHALKYIARRPVVVDNFLDDVGGDGSAFLDAALGETEAGAIPMLEARGVRYILAPIDRQLLCRDLSRGGLFDAMASLGRSPDGAGYVTTPSRLRMLLEVAYRPPNQARAQPLFRVFELVPGALLVGRAEPATPISASLQLTLRQGHTITYLRTTYADTEGAWAIRVPYSTVDAPPSVRPAAHYVVACSGTAFTVPVSEADVRDGSEIRVECDAGRI
jgi:dolichyl-diphosphooligosaccharide--protein glycosyltransferase